jgi:hypothetical protein
MGDQVAVPGLLEPFDLILPLEKREPSLLVRSGLVPGDTPGLSSLFFRFPFNFLQMLLSFFFTEWLVLASDSEITRCRAGEAAAEGDDEVVPVAERLSGEPSVFSFLRSSDRGEIVSSGRFC